MIHFFFLEIEYPNFYCCETSSEWHGSMQPKQNVDQHEQEGDQQGHAARHGVRVNLASLHCCFVSVIEMFIVTKKLIQLVPTMTPVGM